MRTAKLIVPTSLAAVAIAAFGLAGCGKNNSASSASSSSAAPATASAAAPAGAPGSPFGQPHRKEGLWDQEMSMGEMGQMKMQTCVGPEDHPDFHFSRPSAGSGGGGDGGGVKPDCSPPNMNRQLNGDWTFQTSCHMADGMTESTKALIHGDMSSDYSMTADVSVSGAPQAEQNRTMHMSLQAKWLGPCAPGQKPGDVIMNGVDINQMMHGHGAGGMGAMGGMGGPPSAGQ